MTSEKPAESLGAEAQSPGGASAGAQEPALVLCRATAHLPRHPAGYLPALARGDQAWADPADPWVAGKLAAGWLIPQGAPEEIQRGE